LVEPFRLSVEASQRPKTRAPYSAEFRRQMVELVAGRDPTELAREFEPTAQSMTN
jgi:transposase-like protein